MFKLIRVLLVVMCFSGILCSTDTITPNPGQSLNEFSSKDFESQLTEIVEESLNNPESQFILKKLNSEELVEIKEQLMLLACFVVVGKKYLVTKELVTPEEIEKELINQPDAQLELQQLTSEEMAKLCARCVNTAIQAVAEGKL